MNPKLLNNIRRIININTLKNRLNEYFSFKDVEMDMLIYPPMMQDMQENISAEIEVSPYIEELDPRSGIVKLGWNLFLIGTNRKFLGYSTHNSLADLVNTTDNKEAMENSERHTTPNEIINFTVEIFEKYNKSVTGSILTKTPGAYVSQMPVSNTYYSKNKSIGRMT